MAGRYLLLHWKSTKAPSSTQRFNDTMSFLKSAKLLRYYGPLQSCKSVSVGHWELQQSWCLLGVTFKDQKKKLKPAVI